MRENLLRVTYSASQKNSVVRSSIKFAFPRIALWLPDMSCNMGFPVLQSQILCPVLKLTGY